MDGLTVNLGLLPLARCDTGTESDVDECLVAITLLCCHDPRQQVVSDVSVLRSAAQEGAKDGTRAGAAVFAPPQFTGSAKIVRAVCNNN